MDSLHNDFAVKLNIVTPDLDLSRKTKSIESHVKLKSNTSYRVVRDYLSQQSMKQVLNILPERIQEACIGVTKSSINSLPPHVHNIERCVINLYYKVSGEETVFYDGNYDVVTSDVEDSGKGYYLVDSTKIDRVLSYTASCGEVYILNTRKAHSVIDTCQVDDSRLIVQVFLDMDFTQACLILSDNGMIN